MSKRANNPSAAFWVGDGFFGLRLWRWYFKVRDTERHPLMFSERNGHGYRRVARWRSWEFGVRS